MCADINKTDIKLMEPQVLDDTDEGGGQMTGNEVVSGSVNNLFPDISRLDRTYGRVSLRKAFLSVRTEDRATYYGAHGVITEQAADPLVSVTMFSTEDWFDTRQNAQDRMEAYLTKGPQYPAKLYSPHYTGTRNVSMVTEPSQSPPDIGDVLVLLGNPDETDEFEQYIRILDVNYYPQTFIDDKGEFQKQVIELEISSPLEADFAGSTITRNTNYGGLDTMIYTIVVANAANYFGVATLAEEATAGDLTLRVDGIFKPLVPASQSSTPITDFGVGTSRSRLVSRPGITTVSYTRDYNFASNNQLLIGEPIVPGSLTIDTYYDNGAYGLCNNAGTIIGSIDYTSGIIQIGATGGGSASGTWTYTPAISDTQISATASLAIEESNRGFAYVFNCYTLPIPLTMRVHYMAGGKWYTLQDVGNGKLYSGKSVDSYGNPIDVEDLGTGTINYTTGSVSLTLKYMPDIETNIMFSWCDNEDLLAVKETGQTQTLVPRYTGTISWTKPIPGSVVISSSGIADIEDTNADGILYQSATEVGIINYKTGEYAFEPVDVPGGVANFSVAYNDDVTDESDPNYRTAVTVNMNMPTISGGVISFTLDSADLPAGKEIVPGTFSLNISSQMLDSNGVVVGGTTPSPTYRDAGDGNLYLISSTERDVKGTVNYSTGAISLNVEQTGLINGISGYDTAITTFIKASYGV